MSNSESATPPVQSFEYAMERLETVVGEMENSKLPLEDLIRCYEEGTKLVKVCNERLAAAEQRIEIITRDAAGATQIANYPTTNLAPTFTAKPPAPESKPAPVPPSSTGRPAKKSNEVSLF